MRFRKYATALLAASVLTGASAAHAALTPIDVTWNPSAAGITNAPAFTFNNVLLNTFANIDVNGAGTSFTEQGFLRMSTFFLGSTPTSIPNAGFPSGTPYSLYIGFSAAGVQSPGVPSTGHFTALNYSLFGAAGVTNFTQNADGTFSASGAPAVTLATGSLASPGATILTQDPVSGLLQPSAELTATFVPNAAFAGFFVSPPATAILDVTAAFTNTGTVVSQRSLGDAGTRLSLNGGGGNATFAFAPVPEPDTYGMLLAGLGLFGFMARRKAKKTAEV